MSSRAVAVVGGGFARVRGADGDRRRGRPHAGAGVGRGAARLPRHVISALDALDRADARRIEIRAEAAAAFDREMRTALACTVWHSGCTNWYVDENDFDPNQWPWQWATYRRRAARIDLAHYALSS